MKDLIQSYRLNGTQGRLMLFPRGTYKHPEYGRMEFDDAFFDEIIQNFDGGVLGQTKPFIDVDHDHGAAAGWIHALSKEPDGLYASRVEWTPLGKELVGSGQFKHFAQPVDALVLTPTGWVKMGDLQVDDRVIAGDGTPTRVIAVHPQGPRDIYRVRFQDRTSAECTEDHRWFTRTRTDRRLRRPGSVKTTSVIAKTLLRGGGDGRPNHEIPLTKPVTFDGPEPLRLDPWLMGVLLGDGALAQSVVTFSSADSEIVDGVRYVLPSGVRVEKQKGMPYAYRITTGIEGWPGQGRNPVKNALRYYGLEGHTSPTKWVPSQFKFASAAERLAIVQGLMDTDGSAEFNAPTYSATFSTTSDVLADDMEFLVRSLGGVTHRQRKKLSEIGNIPPWDITVRLPDHLPPFRLSRKLDRWTTSRQHARRKHPQRFIVGVEPIGVKDAQCITVEHPAGLYVAEHFIVTGNSPWWGSYRDTGTGKNYDRVLRGGGLTNVPFLKVLPPVELFEPGVDSPARRRARTGGAVFMLSELVLLQGAVTPDDADTRQGRRGAMTGIIVKLRNALGMSAGASLTEVRGAFDRVLADPAELTPEEIAEMERRRKEEEAARAAQQQDTAALGELRQILGLTDNAGLSAVVGAMRALRGSSTTLDERVKGSDAKLSELMLTVRKLSEEIEELKPAAAEATKLRAEATKKDKDHFFTEQVRKGKLVPAERTFFESQWDMNREATEKFFAERKPSVKLAEIGIEVPGEPDEGKDPRVELSEHAMRIAGEKGLDFAKALVEAKMAHPDLVEQIAGMVGPAGIRR